MKGLKVFSAAGNNMVSKSASALANRSIHGRLRRGGTICKFVDQFVLFFSYNERENTRASARHPARCCSNL